MILIDDRAGSESLHARIARALGWTEREATSFSLQSLRELVRPVDPRLAHEIDDAIRSSGYVTRKNRAVESPSKSHYGIRATSSPQLGGRRGMVYGAGRRLSTWELFDRSTEGVVAEYQTRGDAQSALARIRAGRIDPQNAADRRLIEAMERAASNRAGEGLRSGQAILPSLRAMLHGTDPFPTLRDFYASHGHRRQVWLDSLDAFTTDDLLRLSTVAQNYGTAAGVEMKDAIVHLLKWRGEPGQRPRPNRAVGGRLTPEERASAPSKIERKLAEPEAWRGFSIAPANDVEGVPGSIWVHREPDGAVVVRKLGGSQFVRIDPSGDGYEAYVWYRGLRGEEPRMGRMNARRTTIDAAVMWGKDLLTREEREVETRQRMETGIEEGRELPVGAVVRFRDRGARRRYVVARVVHYPTWVDYHLVALSGGEAGSGSSGVRREQVVLDADQTVRFEGAIARKLERQFEYYSSQRSV